MDKERRPRTRFMRQYERKVFQTVMEDVNHIRASIGQMQAQDLSSRTGGQGAQYKPNGNGSMNMFKFIDYSVDVINAVKKELDTQTWQFFKREILDQNVDLSVQSESFLEFQERLGRVFITMGFYPAKKYIQPN